MTTDNTHDSNVLLRVTHLKKHFPIYHRGLFRMTVVNHVRAVDDVSFYIRRGEVLGLVGESGCGKTTTGRVILRAIDPTAGEVFFDDANLGQVDLAKLSRAEMQKVWQNIQLIFQDPYSSLNPRMTLEQIVSEPLRNYHISKPSQRRDRVAELLQLVGMRPEYMSRYPHAFSGGQRQRIGIARALSLNPQLVICDEPVSALDVSVQAQILLPTSSIRTRRHCWLRRLHPTHEQKAKESHWLAKLPTQPIRPQDATSIRVVLTPGNGVK
jgi:peptide/nickel transport system ATP-binding protein